MVTLISGITTLFTLVLVPLCASLFGGWITGGLDLSGIWDTITGFFGNLF